MVELTKTLFASLLCMFAQSALCSDGFWNANTLYLLENQNSHEQGIIAWIYTDRPTCEHDPKSADFRFTRQEQGDDWSLKLVENDLVTTSATPTTPLEISILDCGQRPIGWVADHEGMILPLVNGSIVRARYVLFNAAGHLVAYIPEAASLKIIDAKSKETLVTATPVDLLPNSNQNDLRTGWVLDLTPLKKNNRLDARLALNMIAWHISKDKTP